MVDDSKPEKSPGTADGDKKMDFDSKLLGMYSSIFSMRQEIEKIKKPVGTRENPVRTCKDLFYGHPQFKDGWYWIDPNLGMSDDAVNVYCNMTGQGETCVFPDIHARKMPNIPWRKEGKERWFSSLRGGFKITYETIGRVQMTFLRLLSKQAYQNFTYTCINSAAWYNTQTYNYDSAIKLLGSNDEEFSTRSYRPTVVTDGCKTRKSNGQTVFEIHTEKLHQLPVLDFLPVDYGLPFQAFGFDVGPVCFS